MSRADRVRGLGPLLPMAVVHCKAASLSSSLSSTRNRSPTDEDPMYLPPTVSAALAVSGLNPLEAKLLLGHVLDHHAARQQKGAGRGGGRRQGAAGVDQRASIVAKGLTR